MAVDSYYSLEPLHTQPKPAKSQLGLFIMNFNGEIRGGHKLGLCRTIISKAYESKALRGREDLPEPASFLNELKGFR